MSSLSRHNEIMRIYSRRQDEDRSALERRRGEIYEKIPQIAQLDKRPGTIAMQRYRAYMSGSDANALEALGGELTEVTHERVRLLEQAGYPADYLQMQYTCPICRDTGYDDDGNYCRCYIQMEQEMLRTQSQLRTAVRRENFDKLSMEYYDDEQIIEELGTTQRAYMEKIIADAGDLPRSSATVPISCSWEAPGRASHFSRTVYARSSCSRSAVSCTCRRRIYLKSWRRHAGIRAWMTA